MAFISRMISSATGTKSSKRYLNVAVIGETGAGKSSFINLNHFWSKCKDGEPTEDDFLYAAKNSILQQSNEKGGSHAASQTLHPYCYSFDVTEGGETFHLNIIDTPGLGEDDGLSKDDANVNSILTFLGQQAELHAIVLVLNGSNPRVSSKTRYILQRLYALCPEPFFNQLHLLFTNTRLQPNFDITQVEVPVAKGNCICLDNLLFSPAGRAYEKKTIPEQMTIQSSFRECKQMLSYFFKRWLTCSPVPTDVFNHIRTARANLKLAITKILDQRANLESLSIAYQDALQQLASTTCTKDQLEKLAALTDERIEFVLHNTDYHNTTCMSCPQKPPCHQKCSLERTIRQGDEIFKRCACMTSDGQSCTVCGHSYTQHVHANVLYEVRRIQEPRITAADRAQLDDIRDIVGKQQFLLVSIQRRIDDNNKALTANKQALQAALDQLRRLCPKYDYRLELTCALEMIRDRLLEVALSASDRQGLEKAEKDFKTQLTSYETAKST